MSKFTLSILATAAVLAFAPAANAAVAVTLTPINGPNLSTHIQASLANQTNDATLVYGTTVSGGQNVQFTSPNQIHITDGSGFAAISDSTAVGTSGSFSALTINPDQFFNALQFSVALDGASFILVQYSFDGVNFLSAVTGTDPFAQAANTNKDYQITLTGGGTFDSIRLSTCATALISSCSLLNGTSGTGSTFSLIKQNSITVTDRLGNAVPEPATWAMMLVGFGAAGYSLRRRRRTTALQAA